MSGQKNPLRPPDPNLPFSQHQGFSSWPTVRSDSSKKVDDMSIGSLVRLDSGLETTDFALDRDNFQHQLERDAISRIKRECELKSEFLRRPHQTAIPSHRSAVTTDFPPRKIVASKSAGQFMSEESLAIASAKDPFNESRHNEMKLKPKHYQRSMNMSRAQLDKGSESSRPIPRIKQSKSEPIVQRHLATESQSVEELRESKQNIAHRKSHARLKDVDKISEKLRERSAPRSSLDESGSSRKSSISSGRKKFMSGGKEFAVTLFVNEADKNKILEMLSRAKSVISKKVEKVMGRKTGKSEISDTDALKTVLQNWVEEEEIKSVEEEAEMEGLIEEQVKQVDQLRQMGLSPPIELRPVPTVIDQVPEEDEDDGETVHETDIEVQELIEGGQNMLILPARRFHLSRSATPTLSLSAKSLAPCDKVPRHFTRPESELYPPKLRRPSSLYDWSAQAASSRPVSRQDMLFSPRPVVTPARSLDEETTAGGVPKWIVRPSSMTIPIGGVWRPGDSDNEEEEANFFFGDSKPSESKTSNKDYQVAGKEDSKMEIQSPESGFQEEMRQDAPDVIPRLKRANLDVEDERNIRRVSYLRATKEDRIQVDSDGDDVDPSKLESEVDGKQQVHSIQKILSVFSKKSDNAQPSPSTESNKLEDFARADSIPDSVKEGWLEFLLNEEESKQSEERLWNNVYVVLKPSAIYFYKDKKTAIETPTIYEHIPLNLTDISVEAIPENVFDRKNVFRLKSDVGEDYSLLADSDSSMQSWIQALEDSISAETAKKKGSRKSLTSRNRSPSIQSPMTKNRKGSTDTGQSEKEAKKTWKGKVAKQWKKMQGSAGVTLSSYPEGGSIGVPLEECPLSLESGYDRIPLLVKVCCSIVEERGLDIVGIYRVPGNSLAVTYLTEQVNKGEEHFKLEDPRWNDVNVVSSLLKSFFRKLPDPLFTLEMYSLFIEMSKIEESARRLGALKTLVHELPEQNYETLKFVCCHLYKVMEHSDVNKMELRNLAIVFGPTLVRTSDDNMLSMVTDMAQQCRIIETILSNCDWFFNKDDDMDDNLGTNKKSYVSMMDLTPTTEFTQAGTQSLLLSNLQKLEDARKVTNPSRENVSAKDIVTGIISAANRKMLRAAAGTNKTKKESSDSNASSNSAVTNDQTSKLQQQQSAEIAGRGGDIPGSPRPPSRRNSESVLHGAAAIAAAVPHLMSQLVSSHHHSSTSSISSTTIATPVTSGKTRSGPTPAVVQESSKSLIRSSREFLTRSWNSAHNFMEDNPEAGSSTSKFPIETYQGLDEATAKRIKQFEDETKAMMKRNIQEMARHVPDPRNTPRGESTQTTTRQEFSTFNTRKRK